VGVSSFKIAHNYTPHSRFCGCKALMVKNCNYTHHGRFCGCETLIFKRCNYTPHRRFCGCEALMFKSCNHTLYSWFRGCEVATNFRNEDFDFIHSALLKPPRPKLSLGKKCRSGPSIHHTSPDHP